MSIEMAGNVKCARSAKGLPTQRGGASADLRSLHPFVGGALIRKRLLRDTALAIVGVNQSQKKRLGNRAAILLPRATTHNITTTEHAQ
jgi:hypothetical protein